VTGALLSSSQNLAALVLVVIESLEATSPRTSTGASTPLT
jgi:hypothetical protein